MAKWIFAAVVCCLVGGLQAQTNYCVTSYCSNNRPNVGCNPPGFPGGPACNGLSPQVITLDAMLQKLILDEHNKRRSQLAQGQLLNFQQAIRMPTISWDAELARQAGNNARSCIYKHDSCRNTPVFPYAGQNIAIMQFSGMSMSVTQLINSFINSWWSEFKDTTQSQLNKYPSNYNGPAIGHFTQMASDQTAKMGCAMQHWKNGKTLVYYFVCDYAVTNIIGRAVYQSGPVGQKCNTGRNAAFPGLCSPAEVI